MAEKFLTDLDARRFGDDYVKLLIEALRKEKKNASGKLMNSLDYRLTQTADKIQFIFDGEDYFKFVDEGRKPGSYPPIKDIAKWAAIRGIDKKFAFPIARSIYKFGIKPTHINDKVERRFLNGELFKDLEDYMSTKIEEDVFEQFETLFKNIK